MKLSKVKIKHKVSGEIRKVNEIDWSRDLGNSRYRDFERVGESHVGNADDILVLKETPAVVDQKTASPENEKSEIVKHEDSKEDSKESSESDKESSGDTKEEKVVRISREKRNFTRN